MQDEARGDETHGWRLGSFNCFGDSRLRLLQPKEHGALPVRGLGLHI